MAELSRAGNCRVIARFVSDRVVSRGGAIILHPTKQGWRYAGLVIAVTILYSAAFFPLQQVTGSIASALVAVPVMLSGWVFGRRGGLLGAALGTLLNWCLLALVEEAAWRPLFVRGWPGLALIGIYGYVAGWLGEVLPRLRQQARELEQERRALQAEARRRQQSEESLSRSEARLASILAMAPDAILSVDASQRIILFNRGAEQIFRCSAAAVLGQPLDLLLPERFRASHRERVADYLQSADMASPMAREVTGRRMDGEEFPMECLVSRLQAGDELVLTAVVRDISAGSFIRNLCREAVDQQLVLAVVQMGHALQMQIIAEWVEDAETLELLRSYGADYAQGYYIGKPRPIHEIWS